MAPPGLNSHSQTVSLECGMVTVVPWSACALGALTGQVGSGPTADVLSEARPDKLRSHQPNEGFHPQVGNGMHRLKNSATQASGDHREGGVSCGYIKEKGDATAQELNILQQHVWNIIKFCN